MKERIVFSKEAKGCLQDNVIFKKKYLFENIMSIELPEELNNMPLEMVDKFYPFEERPVVIKSTDDCKVHMTFQLFDRLFVDSDVYEAIESVKQLMDNIYPDRWMSNVYLFNENKRYVGWFVSEIENEFGEMKHIKYVTPVNKCFMLGTITYPKEDSQKWEIIAKYIYVSINDNTIVTE